MNVLLTHGYFLEEDPKEQKIMRPYPPLGLLYISAYLDQKNIKNEIFDTTFSNKNNLLNFLKNDPPKYLGIYINLMTKLNVLEIIRFVKEDHDLKDTTIFLGGPDVRHNQEKLLQHGADFLVIGEGEETAYELISALEENPEKIRSIPGISYLDKQGKNVKNPERTMIKDIDELPFPNREKIDLRKYFETWKTFHGKSAVSVSTMRGCPYTCKWCSRAVYGLSYRRRSPELVAEEIEFIKNTYNPDSLWFVDDVFTIHHRWLSNFRDALKKRDINIPYECITRADRMNEEVVKMLKETGCFRVWIGAESGSQKVIDLMDRRVDVKHVREMIQLTKKYDIEAGTFIMLGYPGETEKDIEETIEHLKRSDPDHFTITVAYPIRGTELYEEVEALKTTDPDWDKSTDRDIDFKRTYSRQYYNWAVKRVVNEVKWHKGKKNGFGVLNNTKHKIKSIAAKMGMQFGK